MGAREKQFVRQLRVGTLGKNVVRTQSYSKGFAIFRNFHPQVTVLVDKRRTCLVEMPEEVVKISAVADDPRIDRFFDDRIQCPPVFFPLLGSANELRPLPWRNFLRLLGMSRALICGRMPFEFVHQIESPSEDIGGGGNG